jgi:hypothetical protein
VVPQSADLLGGGGDRVGIDHLEDLQPAGVGDRAQH